MYNCHAEDCHAEDCHAEDCHAERTITWQDEKCVNVLVYNWFYLTILGKAFFTQKYLQ